jgi:hypothetical protein
MRPPGGGKRTAGGGTEEMGQGGAGASPTSALAAAGCFRPRSVAPLDRAPLAADDQEGSKEESPDPSMVEGRVETSATPPAPCRAKADRQMRDGLVTERE